MNNLTLLFFANLREQVACEKLSVEFIENETIEQLIQRLITMQGEAFNVLTDTSVKAAINSNVAESGSTLLPGAEVAFFPPVTGG